MSNYKVNYARLAVLLLPTFLRKPLLVAFLSAIMRPLDNQHSKFTAYMDGLDLFVYSQICYMRALLNDQFDYYERRIKVRTCAIDESRFLLWSRGSNKAHLLPQGGDLQKEPYYLPMRGYVGFENPDFEIVLPIGFTLSENETNTLKSLINANKLASKTYRITYE